MPVPALLFPILLSLAAAEDPPITVTAYPWAPFISPMGEPFRGGANRTAPIARWFERADINRDGRIDPQEITAYEWEIAPDIQVNSNWKRPRGQPAPKPQGDDWDRKDKDGHDGYHVDGLQGAARYGLLNIPQPVASADADFNRVITLAEFRQAAADRFRLLDSQGQGRIGLQALEARLPTRPEGRRAKPKKDRIDDRIGQPLPKGD